MLLGGYSGGQNVAYRNNKLSKNEWVMAMNKILNCDGYVYTDGDGLSQTAYDYDFSFSWDPGDDFNHITYYDAYDMIKSQQLALYSDNGYVYQYYTLYSYKPALTKFIAALNLYYSNDDNAKPGLVQVTEKMKDTYGETSSDYKDALTAQNKYKALKDKIAELNTVLGDQTKYEAYTNMINEYIGYANEVRSLFEAYSKAETIADAYDNYSVSNNESTVATLEDAIKGYNDKIDAANKTINETINNGITDQETLIAYYTTLIAELNSEIAANQAVADKYRALIAGSGSSNNQQQQQSTPAPEQTPAE